MSINSNIPVSNSMPLSEGAKPSAEKSIKQQIPPLADLTSEKTAEETKKMLESADHLIHGTTEKLDQDYICTEKSYNDSLAFIQTLQELIEYINISEFVSGVENKRNEEILAAATNSMRLNAMRFLLNGEAKDLNTANKKLVGVLDRYDKTDPKGTYILRTALLKASHAAGVGLHSWSVYTKGGKPEGSEIWGFLEKGKNWIPEAQGLRAKWIEITSVKTNRLSKKFKDNQVVLLKGGFGAGKTRQILERFGVYGAGAIAPDKGKAIDRRINPDLPHFAAQAHGSQAAFELMDELLQKQTGTVIYDSSLYKPEDVAGYLAKCKKAGKKMVIYDVARNDMARILSVLKRPVEGEDPRIPPHLIIESAIRDKVNRVKCMQIVLDDDTKVGSLRPEYHFISGDEQGWNAEEVMELGPEGTIVLKPGAEERLALEGIEFSGNTLKLTVNEESLEKYYEEMFDRPVREIMAALSFEEQSTLGVFQQRIFPTKLYDDLPKNIRDALPKKAFEDALENVDFSSKQFFTYEDLPLRAALSLHQHLKKDPWK